MITSSFVFNTQAEHCVNYYGEFYQLYFYA